MEERSLHNPDKFLYGLIKKNNIVINAWEEVRFISISDDLDCSQNCLQLEMEGNVMNFRKCSTKIFDLHFHRILKEALN